MEVRMGYIWKQEWEQDFTIYGSKNRLYVEARMGYMWKQEWEQELAIHGSSNGPYMEAVIGYIIETSDNRRN